MKYTRYDIRKRKTDSLVLIIIALMILILSFIIGSIISKLILKNKSYDINKSVPSKTAEKQVSNVQGNNLEVIYTAIQGGMFQNKDNALEEINVLKKFGSPFIIEEEGKYRVFLGIYKDSKAKEMCKILNDNKVESSNMNFNIKQSDVCDNEIIEIFNGYTEILEMLNGKNVKAIQTEDFKTWCLSLKEVDSKAKNIKLLTQLKDNIKGLPQEIKKEDISNYYSFLYNSLKSLQKSLP